MASVHYFLPTASEFSGELQEYGDAAERVRFVRYKAAMTINRYARGQLVRRYLRWLAFKATIIQSAYRAYKAKGALRAALKSAVLDLYSKYYAKAAMTIQGLWRGHVSRRQKFCYRRYRRWLATVKERGERRAAEALEFGLRSRADDLSLLEDEARQWLAYVIFKLHHLLRTSVCAGVYSEPATTQLSEFEKLLKSIKYTEYMKRLKRKYDEFVRKHRPAYSNKKLFPIIGYGVEYWYLSLFEMYELTSPVPKIEDSRHKATHHGKIHKEPFLWKKVRPQRPQEGRGPFTPTSSSIQFFPPPPAPTIESNSRTGAGDTQKQVSSKDPRFHLYVKHYRPSPALFDYVDFHVNVLLKRKFSVQNIDVDMH